MVKRIKKVQEVISSEFATEINELLRELASEIDLHYEDEDFFALGPTIEAMAKVGSRLEELGYTLPDAYYHVMGRYHRHWN